MKALALVPGTTDLQLIDRPEPQVTTPTQVKVKVFQVGICGTDREEAAGGRADAPPGQKELVIGHEMFGQVVAIGGHVKSVRVGDYGVFMVRRPCGKCVPCLSRRSDMCLTGNYTERGIKMADGFQQEFVIDDEQFLIKVPKAIKDLGVLTEPMSVGEKAIDEAVRIQVSRMPGVNYKTWLQGKKALVVGLGPIGLLGAVILRLRGATVFGMDIQDEATARPTLLKALGGTYIDGRQTKATDIDDKFGKFDFIFEATGVAQLEIDLIDALGINGAYVLTGIPSGNRPVTMDAAVLMQQLVLKNQIVVGSVNASYDHYSMAVADIVKAAKVYPEVINKIITDRHPYTDFQEVLAHHSSDEIKCVLEWSK